MSKTVLMAAAAAFALTAGSAMAATTSVGVHGAKIVPTIHVLKGASMLYNQNSNNTGVGLASMNFTSGSITNENSAGADDFVVPKGKTWKVKEVDVSGIYYNNFAAGPATDENVFFYKDKNGKPGKRVAKILGLHGTDNAGSFSLELGKKAVKLTAGTYWVSVVADMNFEATSQWGWYINSQIHGNPAMWENPDNGYGTGCTTWGELGTCVGYSGDFMFDLQGKG
ncbi:MAG TPA: hypothetical protein VGL35_12985 [Rhizomicrobium sp.]|jgi:hypothetical protein